MSDRAVGKPLRMAYRALFSCLSSSCQQQQRNYGQAAVRDAYKVLGLKTNASLGEVKAAYRRLALKCHPDLHSKGSAEFMRIKAAYEQISSKSIVSVTKSQGQRRSYGRSYSGIRRPARNAITLWGLGLATSFILVGTLLYWGRIGMSGSIYQKRPSRVIEAQPNAVTKKQIAALLIQKSKQKRDEN